MSPSNRMITRVLPFALVDVFAHEPLAGNGLAIFLLDQDLPSALMQGITGEMRQFETIFLRQSGAASRFVARIFTMDEELPFAGHPVIGAAAWLHAQLRAGEPVAEFEFVLGGRSIVATSRREGTVFRAEMQQGKAVLGENVPAPAGDALLQALNLSATDLEPGLPLQVVSTGLPYLIVPLCTGLERARIGIRNFEALLGGVGAKFVYVLDVESREGRTWDNDGRVEDIATGSAVGPAAAYLVAHGRARPDEVIAFRQGRFAGRLSELHALVHGGSAPSVTVRGQVCFVGDGRLRLPAEG